MAFSRMKRCWLWAVVNISSEGLVVGFLENHHRDTKSMDIDVATEEVASENGNHSRDMMRYGSFSYSFQKICLL